MTAHASCQHGQREGFRDVIVGTGFESIDHVELLAFARDHHDRSFGMASSQLPAQFDAVTIRKTEIDQRLAGRGDGHGVETSRQTSLEGVTYTRIVFDDQHSRPRAGHVAQLAAR